MSPTLLERILPWAELAYYGSGVLLAMVGAYAAQQVRIMKRDSLIRNERAAKEKAIEYSSRYLGEFVSLDAEFYREIEEGRLPDYDGPVGAFTPAAVPKELRKNPIERFSSEAWLPSMNELQSIAAAFVTGVADEEVGFQIIGRTYCRTVESRYDLLCLSQDAKVCRYFSSITELYRLWRPRLAKAELRATQSGIAKALHAIPDARIAPIGTSED